MNGLKKPQELTLEDLETIRQLKLKAIDAQDYTTASDLRSIEKRLRETINKQLTETIVKGISL